MAYRGFNILRSQLTPPTAWDKIYQWMVGTARVIIIIVEIIVVVAFAARVVVDTIAKNLDETIARRDAELAAFRSTELQYLDIQNKTLTYSDLWMQSSGLSFYYNYINSLIRNYSGLITVSINHNEITLSGELPLSDVKIIEEKMKESKVGSSADPIFLDVTLTDVDSSGQSQNEIASFSIIGYLIKKDFYRELNKVE